MEAFELDRSPAELSRNLGDYPSQQWYSLVLGVGVMTIVISVNVVGGAFAKQPDLFDGKGGQYRLASTRYSVNPEHSIARCRGRPQFPSIRACQPCACLWFVFTDGSIVKP